jgi:hypothetical protein
VTDAANVSPSTRWITGTALAALALGAIHVAVTGVVWEALGIAALPRDGQLGFIFVFVATGVATLFAGGLALYAATGARRGERWGGTVAAACGGFVALVGLGALLTGPDNPFAWISLAVGLAQLLAALRARAACAAPRPRHEPRDHER